MVSIFRVQLKPSLPSGPLGAMPAVVRHFCRHHCKWESSSQWYVYHGQNGASGRQCRNAYQRQFRAVESSALIGKVNECDGTGASIGFLAAREDVAAMQCCASLLHHVPMFVRVLVLGFTQNFYWKEPIVMATTLLLVQLPPLLPWLRLDPACWTRHQWSTLKGMFRQILSQVREFTRDLHVACSTRGCPTLLPKGRKRGLGVERKCSIKNPSKHPGGLTAAATFLLDLRCGEWPTAAKVIGS